MKKIILSVFTFCGIIGFINAQTLIPDSNFEQALINLGLDSGPINGSVQTSSIDTVISLNVSGLSISDLTGIEDFTALEVLNCSSNQLNTLNVTQNANLKDLRCDVNQLTGLNVTQNLGLLYLNCGLNQIANIDLSQNTQLVSFICNNSALASVDLSQNTALTYFSCTLNPSLTSVDVRNGNNANVTYFSSVISANLKCIYVDNKNATYLSSWSKDVTSHWVNDTLDCQNITSVIDYKMDVPFDIYPNPAYDYAIFDFEKSPDKLTIYNLENQLVLEKTIEERVVKIDTSEFEKGIYLCNWIDNDEVVVKKLIIL